MKKILISTILVAIGCFSMTAQSSVLNNPDNKAYFGIRVGADVSCPGNITAGSVGLSVFNNGGGFEFGGIYNIPVVANFYIEPGLKLYYDTYSLKEEWVKFIQGGIILDSGSIRKFGMRIPVVAGYHFDFTDDVKVSVFTGPELEVGFSGKEYLKGHNIETSGSVYGDNGSMNRANILWTLGAGIAYQHFYFDIKGGIGMANMLSDSDATLHENHVTFTLGYNF
ncbi:MAG: PorT family protein [Muribaculaceae bacterium]|nr:PorT family protein [Muribaculaceae bacterium]